jgi:uncharacterized membrane protein
MGGRLYHDVPYTYPPLYAYTEALAIGLLGNNFLGWRATAQVYDLGLIILIYLIVLRIFGQKKALFAVALYGFSPLPLIATSIYASFDSTAAFWMLASILLLLKKKTVPSAVALGIGAAYKYFPILLLPPLLMYLSGKRSRILFSLSSILTLAAIQLPFALSDFSSWFYNVILYHVERSGGGATIYNLISLHPQLWDIYTPLTTIFPISLAIIFLLVSVDKDATEIGLLKKATLVMVATVFFNKVVLFYALWFIPLVCTVIVAQRKRQSLATSVLLISLQAFLLAGVYVYTTTVTESATVFAMLDLYLLTSALLLIWLLRDRLISVKATFSKRKPTVQAYR